MYSCTGGHLFTHIHSKIWSELVQFQTFQYKNTTVPLSNVGLEGGMTDWSTIVTICGFLDKPTTDGRGNTMLETLEPDTKADTTGKKRRNLAATDSCRNTEICIINDETPSSSSRKITTPCQQTIVMTSQPTLWVVAQHALVERLSTNDRHDVTANTPSGCPAHTRRTTVNKRSSRRHS